jgi:hypothetical protein
MTFLTSYSRRSIGAARSWLVDWSREPPLVRRQAGGAAGDIDQDGEADADGTSSWSG